MLCEKCNTNPATIHYTKVIGGDKTEYHLCTKCAREVTEGSGYGRILPEDNEISKLLSWVFGGAVGNDEEQEDSAYEITCPCCGMTYGDFVKQSRFGCHDCYDVFGLLISDKIKKIHGSDTHVGKKPKQMKYDRMEITEENITAEDRINILRKKLKEAVLMEDFEEAARLRDEINALKEDGGKVHE